MLKPRHCYANEQVYNYNLFLDRATAIPFALDPSLMTQVKFILNNEETEELKLRSRFIIQNQTERTNYLYVDDAKELLAFIDLIRDPRITTLNSPKEKFRYSTGPSLDRPAKFCNLHAKIGDRFERIIGISEVSNKDYQENRNIRNEHFINVLDRFESILRLFIGVVEENKAPVLDRHFQQGRFCMIPLNNKWNGPHKSHFLRLNWTQKKEPNNIMFSVDNKAMLFYGFHSENSWRTEEVVSAFIEELENLTNDYLSFNEENAMFMKARKVYAGADRADLMEYVSGRGVGSAAGARTMIININSDAAPIWSKVAFRYEKDFMTDLYAGLRFLTNYEIK